MFLKIINILILLLLVTHTCFTNTSRSINIQNHIRVGYDDNLNNSVNASQEIDTLYISDIFKITAKFVPTSSSTFLFFYQPEFTYRLDADDEHQYLQDMYVNYIRAVSPISQLQITDRFRISEPDLNQIDGRSFTENNLNISYQKNVRPNIGINLLAGYTTRENEDNQNTWFQTRDFERLRLSYLISKTLDKKDKAISGGINYNNHEIKHDGGSIASSTIFGGYDYPVNKKLMTSTQFGYTFAEIEGGSSSPEVRDSSSPFFELGLNYELSKYTDINTSYSYSLRYTTLSVYNAELRADWLFAIRHRFTPKINTAISYSLVNATYESDFLRNYDPSVSELDDMNSIINIRTQYMLNTNHSLECGVQLRERKGWDSVNQDYTRNKFYFGWKLTI